MKKLVLAPLILLTLMLGACASLGTGSTGERLVVQIATMKVIEAGPDRKLRAERISTIASEAKSWLRADNVTVTALKAAATARIANLNLEPSDQLLAALLVETVAAELEKRVGDGLIPADKLISVDAVLGYVVDAAAFY